MFPYGDTDFYVFVNLFCILPHLDLLSPYVDEFVCHLMYRWKVFIFAY